MFISGFVGVGEGVGVVVGVLMGTSPPIVRIMDTVIAVRFVSFMGVPLTVLLFVVWLVLIL